MFFIKNMLGSQSKILDVYFSIVFFVKLFINQKLKTFVFYYKIEKPSKYKFVSHFDNKTARSEFLYLNITLRYRRYY